MALEDDLKNALLQTPDETATIDPWSVVRAGRRRTRQRRLLFGSSLVLVVLGATAIALTAAPNTARTTAVTAGGDSATRPASSDPAVVVAYQEQIADWVGCLQRNGIAVKSPSGHPYDALIQELGEHKGDPDYATATQKCVDLLPVITPELEKAWGQDPLTLLSVEQVQSMKDYAACMQENGATEFPTPGANGFTEAQWTTWNRVADEPSAKSALSVCGPLSLTAPQ